MLQIDKEVLNLLFPYNPTGEDIDAIQAVKEWEESNRRIKVLRGNLARVNHQLNTMKGKQYMKLHYKLKAVTPPGLSSKFYQARVYKDGVWLTDTAVFPNKRQAGWVAIGIMLQELEDKEFYQLITK